MRAVFGTRAQGRPPLAPRLAFSERARPGEKAATHAKSVILSAARIHALEVLAPFPKPPW